MGSGNHSLIMATHFNLPIILFAIDFHVDCNKRDCKYLYIIARYIHTYTYSNIHIYFSYLCVGVYVLACLCACQLVAVKCNFKYFTVKQFSCVFVCVHIFFYLVAYFSGPNVI